MSSSRDRDISGYPNLGDIQIFRAEVINNNDEKQKSRFQCRMIGHETDLINMPDEHMQWYSVLTPETAHRGMGYNPRYVPGDQVYCLQFGDERIILGAVRKESTDEGEEADINPWTLDGTGSPKSPPDETNDKNKGWQGGLRSEKVKTTEDKTEFSRQSKRNRQESKKIQGERIARNIYNRTQNRFGKNLSIGKDIPFNNGKNPMQFIVNMIQNDGSVTPEMLQMVEQLRTKAENFNPHAIQAVGPQNYASFIRSLIDYFKGLKTQSQKQNDEDDEDVKREEEQDQTDLEKALALINEPETTISISTTIEALPDDSDPEDTAYYVVKTGNVADNQIPIFISDGAVEGDPNLTWDGSTLAVNGTITGTISVDGISTNGSITANGVNTPYINTSRGKIRITPYMTTDSSYVDQSAELKQALIDFFDSDCTHLDFEGQMVGISNQISLICGVDGFTSTPSAPKNFTKRIVNGGIRWLGGNASGTSMLSITCPTTISASAAFKEPGFESFRFDAGGGGTGYSINCLEISNFYHLKFRDCVFADFADGVGVFLSSQDNIGDYTDDNGATFESCRWVTTNGLQHSGTPILAYCGDIVVVGGWSDFLGPMDFHIGSVTIDRHHFVGNLGSPTNRRYAAIFRDPRAISIINNDLDGSVFKLTNEGFLSGSGISNNAPVQGAATSFRNIIITDNRFEGYVPITPGEGVITIVTENAGTDLYATTIADNKSVQFNQGDNATPFLKVLATGSGSWTSVQGSYRYVDGFGSTPGDTDFGAVTHSATGNRNYIGEANVDVGYITSNGISLKSVVASSNTNLDNHLKLWGTGYGFGVTSFHLNMVAAGVNVLQANTNYVKSKIKHLFEANVETTGAMIRMFGNDSVDSSRIQFNIDNSQVAWAGVPNWDTDSFRLYGPNSAATGAENFLTYTQNNLVFYSGGTEKMRINPGSVTLGLNDVDPMSLYLYGGANGETSGVIRIYNPDDNDSSTEAWQLVNYSGDFCIQDVTAGTVNFRVNDSTGTIALSQASGIVTVGTNDSVPGVLHLYGGGAGEVGGELRIYNNADDDTATDYWALLAHDSTGQFHISANGTTPKLTVNNNILKSYANVIIENTTDPFLAFTETGNNDGMRIVYEETGQSLRIQGSTSTGSYDSVEVAWFNRNGDVFLSKASGNLFVGVNDTTPATLHLYGGGTGELGGRLRIYNDADQDTTVDYWQLEADFNGNFTLGPNTDTNMMYLTQAGAIHLATGGGNVFIGADDTTPSTLHLYGGPTFGGTIRIYQGANEDANNEYHSISSDGGTLLFRDDGNAVGIRMNDDLSVDFPGGPLGVKKTYTVAGLPSPGALGEMAVVTDATGPTFGNAPTGGGSANAMVWHNGLGWRVMGI